MSGKWISFVSDVLMLAVILTVCGTADARRGDPPKSVTLKVAAISDVKVLHAGPIDRATALAEDKARVEPGPMRFALPEDVSITPANHGTWENLADGGRLWRLQIHAPNATDLNFGFLKYRLPPGATLHIVSEDNDYYQGPFTAKDNKAHGEFWSPLVPGERAVLELYVPAGSRFEPELELGRIGRGYRDLFSKTDDLAKQASCNIDVVCDEGNAWRDEIRSVGRYTVSGEWACSGTLIMDVPGSYKPFFISAHHCDVSTANDQTVRVYWNYESPSCGQLGGGSLSQSQTGAIFRASREDNDMLLLKLEDTPDASFNVYYAGWDARTSTRPQSSVHIHHPRADEKAITFNDDPLTIMGHCGGFTSPSDSHWYANVYERGTTETGSSGSGVWDPATHYLVGYLSWGDVGDPCGGNVSDCHGRFAIGWNGSSSSSRLRDWLDPSGTGTLTKAGANPDGSGGGGSWDCGNAGYDNNTTDQATYFGGGLAGSPDHMFAVKIELADFGYQPGNVQITGFCAANNNSYNGGPWPNEVFIYPDDGGSPDDGTILGQGTIRTGDGTGSSSVTLTSPVTLNGDFWLVVRGDAKWEGEDFNVEFDTGTNVGNSYLSSSGISGLGLRDGGNLMLRATLQEGSGGGGEPSDCGNAYYDNGTWEGTAWFGGSGAGDSDNIYGVKFELADFGFTPGNTQITGFCAGNQHAWTGGPWPNEVFIYADSGGLPNESAKLGQGTVYTGDGAPGEWYEVNLSSPVTLNGDFWVVMRGDPKWTGEDFNTDYDNAGSSNHSYGSDSGVAGLLPATVGNYMLRAKLQEGGGGGGTGDGAYNYFLAAIAHTPGVGDALWRSKMGVLNRSGSSADVTFTYYWKNGPTTVKTTAVRKSIFNGRLETWDDAAVSLFGVTAKSSGSVLINSTRPLVVTARTYNVGEDGSFGSFMPGVVAADGVSTGGLGILSQLTGNDDFRTNVGLVNLSNKTCEARVRVISASGATLGTAVTKTLGAHKFTQINNVFAATGAGSRNNAYATVEVLTSGCEVWAYGAVIDGTGAFPGTDDATTVPLAVID